LLATFHPTLSELAHSSIEEHKDHGDSSRERSRGSYLNESLVGGDRDSSERNGENAPYNASNESKRCKGTANAGSRIRVILTADIRSGIIAVRERFPISDMYKSPRIARSTSMRARAHAPYIQHSSFALSPFFPFISREFVGLFEYRAPRFSLFLSVRPAEHVLRALLQFYGTPGTFFSSNVLFALYSRRDCRYRG